MIEQRLARWGHYMRTEHDYGLGFPKRTVLHRCIVEGPAASAPTAKDNEPVPSDIEAIESALNRIPDRDKRLAISLYVEEKPVPLLRRVMGVDRDFMEEIIGRMHARVESALDERAAA
jgi:hypothetical protein